ncbi:hypothetical protein Y032_0681g1480 [Ancylostoma ceylanicum]|uniref:Uncharacterized protein n=1 Tax=Ancylostoma ceylanicum TaxID=53326 RepID=A0A016WGT4_9BILA|nr:hypothetical protein Y032_0681g1480 [Ancylostoma ceylanicum]
MPRAVSIILSHRVMDFNCEKAYCSPSCLHFVAPGNASGWNCPHPTHLELKMQCFWKYFRLSPRSLY